MVEPAQQDSSEFSAGQEALSNALNVSFTLLRWFMLVLFVGYLLSGIFVVKQHERAFVLIFGKIDGVGDSRIKGPGAHWTWPRPFSEIVRVPTERAKEVKNLSFFYGLRELEDGTYEALPSGSSLFPGRDGYTLTADANILHTRWAFQYTVKDPEAFYLRHKDGETLISRMFEDAVVQTSATLSFDEALRTAVQQLQSDVLSQLRRSCAELELGVQIENVRILDNIPPQQVMNERNAVLQEETRAGVRISRARKEADQILTSAIGEAERVRRQGESAKQELLSEIKADAAYFDKIYAQYVDNPTVISQMLRQDSVRRALSQAKARYIIHPLGDGQKRMLKIPMAMEKKNPMSEHLQGSNN